MGKFEDEEAFRSLLKKIASNCTLTNSLVGSGDGKIVMTEISVSSFIVTKKEQRMIASLMYSPDDL